MPLLINEYGCAYVEPGRNPQQNIREALAFLKRQVPLPPYWVRTVYHGRVIYTDPFQYIGLSSMQTPLVDGARLPVTTIFKGLSPVYRTLHAGGISEKFHTQSLRAGDIIMPGKGWNLVQAPEHLPGHYLAVRNDGEEELFIAPYVE